jgi:hypothetical protein
MQLACEVYRTNGLMLKNGNIDGLWKLLKEMARMCPSRENALHRDAKFIGRLLEFDKATLSYGLLQYRFRWSTNENDIAVLMGDLRKIGLIPALAALFISMYAAVSAGDSNPALLLLRDFVFAVVILYLISFLALSRRRHKQVIQLLEYAIQHADQYNTSPSDTTAEAESTNTNSGQL